MLPVEVTTLSDTLPNKRRHPPTITINVVATDIERARLKLVRACLSLSCNIREHGNRLPSGLSCSTEGSLFCMVFLRIGTGMAAWKLRELGSHFRY